MLGLLYDKWDSKIYNYILLKIKRIVHILFLFSKKRYKKHKNAYFEWGYGNDILKLLMSVPLIVLEGKEKE